MPASRRAAGLISRKLIPAWLKSLVWISLSRVATSITRVGERLGASWLIYNPLLFLWFHLAGVTIAPTIYDGLRRCFPAARRYLDVGSGTGTMAAFGRRTGLDVQACEHARVARWFARRQGVPCVEFDLMRDPPAETASDFDLAYCFEVGEHLPAELSAPLVKFVASKAPWIVFSAAQPGQGGHGHINEQPDSYWIELFTARGCRYQSELTRTLREHFANAPVHVEWLVKNVLVFDASD